MGFEIVPHGHPVEVFGGVFEAFLCSHVCHLFVGNPDNFAPDVVSCIGCFIGNIWTVSTVILPSFKEKSVNNDPARVVGVLADYIKERIRGGSFPETVIPFAFEVRGELEDANIEGSLGFIREGVIVIDRGIGDGQVFLSGMVGGVFTISVDYGVKDWVSVIIGEGGRDSPSIFISSFGVVRRDKA